MTKFEVIDREIGPKGKCYIICTEFDGADFDAQLARVCDTAVQRGADRLYFACRDKRAGPDADAFTAGGYSFHHYSNFDTLRKRLASVPAQTREPLRCKPLRTAQIPLFLALYNESFFSVPNAMTMTGPDATDILADEKRDAGFLLLGGEPVGVFELDYRGDVPEIAAICIRPELRNCGYGTAALNLLETRLAGEGADTAELLAASANERAYRLYLMRGYAFFRRIGSWYAAWTQALHPI